MSSGTSMIPDLRSWDDIKELGWNTLLLGNGFSINISNLFSYSSLYWESVVQLGPSGKIFDGLGTTNFEEVLEALLHTELVVSALGADSTKIQNLYTQVRHALFDTIKRVHVPWCDIPNGTLSAVATALRSYDRVFTTNYDLLPYWSLVEAAPFGFADLFLDVGNAFNPRNTEIFSGKTGLYFLHGAVHLWQDDSTGATGKWTSGLNSLLERLETVYTSESLRRPLFVSEGNSEKKLRTIRRSDYLAFALEELRRDSSATVVFGHSLGSSDVHIAEALADGTRQRFAVSVRPGPHGPSPAYMGHVLEALRGHEVYFFDSRTHPLGSPSLTVPTTP